MLVYYVVETVDLRLVLPFRLHFKLGVNFGCQSLDDLSHFLGSEAEVAAFVVGSGFVTVEGFGACL